MLKIYNTLSKRKEVFRPAKQPLVRMYTCGPTVYDFAHIGNFRSYIVADIVRRYLEYRGYKVKYVKNITDVGHFTQDDVVLGQDKMILASKREKKGPYEIAEFYTRAFFKDERKLNIKKADVYPRASKHIKEIIELIKILLKKGYAYRLSDGIYFHVPKFKEYGKLSGNTLDKLRKGVRIEPNPEKRHPADFALWKFAKPEQLMQWPSPWRRGFPGWHIECSAMSMKYLGKGFDIHTGGEDNIFPHHEDEIAQSESATGKKFVRFWIHVRHLLVEGEKMAKSKGNFYTLGDLENKGYSPLAFRFLVLTARHRNKFNFTFRGLKEAEKNLEKVSEFVEKLNRLRKQKEGRKKRFAINLVLKTQKEFEKAMDDDFNTPAALTPVFHLISRGNYLLGKNKLTPSDAGDILEVLRKIDKVFGFILCKKPKEKIPEKVLELVREREKCRKENQWELADKLRNKVRESGYLIEDTREGPKIKKI